MGIKKILVLILSVAMFLGCGHIEVDYYHVYLKLINETNYDIKVEWEVDVDCDKAFTIPAGEIKRVPMPAVNSATITFEDGSILKYTKQDKGRSLCNNRYYERLPRSYDRGYIFTNTDYYIALSQGKQ
ncbi:MAG: hypothetical protein IJF63_00775 [Alistipes sp.]|nr:hypothetical protein [Alistipes sp.]